MIQLDTRLGWLNPSVISFNAMSVGTCKLEFELTENRQVVDLTSLRVMIEVKCPSGSVIEDHVEVVNAQAGLIEKELASNMIVEQGLHYVELSIYSADNKKLLVTNKARYNVGVNFGEEGVKATSQYSTLQELIFDVEEIKNNGIIDMDKIQELEKEAVGINQESKRIENDVTTKHTDIVSKYEDITTKTQQISKDTNRTEVNAQQVSTDKGVVTRFKNEVAENTNQVATNTQQVAEDKIVVEQAKLVAIDKSNIATTQADIATQKAQEISSSADQINRSKQELVDSVPSGAKSGQLFFVRKG